jgi:ABC-type transport system involved in cytochrome c biogenesis permease subunit
MAALNDIWLYIHTNMIIWSYAVIGLACIPALLLLRHYWIRAWDDRAIPGMRLLILPAAVVILNVTSGLMVMHFVDPLGYGLVGPRLPDGRLVSSLPALEILSLPFAAPRTAFWAIVNSTMVLTTSSFLGSLMIVLLEVMAARARRLGGAVVERAASGGASALMMSGAGGSNFLRQERPSATQVFDGATMVLVELSFIMLWTGLVMGAIWADHSWGRPWGWDPKEVFALNTFIIFLILIHVRLKVKDKAFWTAVLAVFGFEVMMFNWIVVNFVITGLHSYA